MSSWEDQLKTGLKVLEHLKASTLHAQKTTADRPAAPIPTVAEVDEKPLPPVAEQVQGPPSLQSVLSESIFFPPSSVLLGSCEDGVPLHLDLTNPAAGSLLICGDPGSGKSRLLSAILTSAAWLNSPEQVSYYLLVRKTDEFSDLADPDHCQAIQATDKPQAAELIKELLEEIEIRKRGVPGPAIVLAIDDLANLLRTLDDSGFSDLYRLVRHGPRMQVWTIATLSTRYLQWIDRRMLDAFRTHLLGSTTDALVARRLAGDIEQFLQSLTAGQQFGVCFRGEWVKFWVCAPKPGKDKEADHANRNAVV